MEKTKSDKIKIILCDDHELVRKGLRNLLEEYPDFEVAGEATNGQQAVEMAKRLAPDVVLCDIRMPGLSGIDVVKQLKERSPEIRVITLSAYDDDEYIVELIQAGAAGYLLKTADASELTQAIRTAYHGGMVIHPAIAARLGNLWSRTKTPPATSQDLTPRELEILHLTADGLPNKAIAAKLKLSIRTVEAYLGRIYSKMKVDSRSKAVHYAYAKQIIDAGRKPGENHPDGGAKPVSNKAVGDKPQKSGKPS